MDVIVMWDHLEDISWPEHVLQVAWLSQGLLGLVWQGHSLGSWTKGYPVSAVMSSSHLKRARDTTVKDPCASRCRLLSELIPWGLCRCSSCS